MELQILSQTENKPLERTEVVATITNFAATPSRPDVLAELAKKVSGTKECIIVTKIDSKYGNKAATVFAQVYSSKESLAKYGHKKLAARVPKGVSKAAAAAEKK